MQAIRLAARKALFFNFLFRSVKWNEVTATESGTLRVNRQAKTMVHRYFEEYLAQWLHLTSADVINNSDLAPEPWNLTLDERTWLPTHEVSDLQRPCSSLDLWLGVHPL